VVDVFSPRFLLAALVGWLDRQQQEALGWLFGGYPGARLVHFLAMCGMLAFVPGHLLLVALHGWDNFASMLTGWKQHPVSFRQYMNVRLTD
jgi:thiosulfate reductase cytochrome b subunit